MSDQLILDFPILQKSGGDFTDTVAYEVTADRDHDDKEMRVTHILKGASFISQLVKDGTAKFSVRLLYRDSTERYYDTCETLGISTENEITANQRIKLKFSYAPEVMPSIILLKEQKITADDLSGLTDFWKDEQFFIPKYSRIAIAPSLAFTSGDVAHLMTLRFDKQLGDGEMKVTVKQDAGEGETPVVLECGQGVYDQLQKVTQANPTNAVESMRSAIATQALCAIYAHMKSLSLGDDYTPSGVLAAHLQFMVKETGENWENEDFNPSLAATKMWPYNINALQDG